MKVLKFGGTSVGTVASLNNVKKIVEAIHEPCVVVVSALGGLTDRLIETARMASEGNPQYAAEADAMAARHADIIRNVVPQELQSDVSDKVSRLLAELRRIYDGVSLIKALPQATLDVIVSFGERMSSVIVAAMIKNARRYDSLDFVKTERWFNKNIADQKLTTQLIEETFKGLDCTAIVPGFISTDRESGEITNLGRGGSDFTAALIAAALNADVLEIWTDVDGFLTADPRIIPQARLVPHMSFIESMELCTFGAKVIYPPTIYPVFHKNIPIKILNTFNPGAPGTLITDAPHSPDLPIKGVSSIKGVCLFKLKGNAGIAEKSWSTRAADALSRRGVNVFLVANPEIENEVTLTTVAPEADAARKLLEAEFAPEITAGRLQPVERLDAMASVAVVGENMKSRIRLRDRIRHSLQREAINVEAFSSGSDTTLSFIVDQSRVEDTLRIVHSLVFI